MARGRDPDPPCCQKYGVPLYGAAWVPVKEALKQNPKEEPEQDSDKVTTDEGSSPPPSVDTTSKGYLVCAGGGGEGHSGIPNALLLLDFDFASNSLSQIPVTKLNTGDDLPYRMAVHPGGEGVICSLPKSCRWFEWDAPECTEGSRLGLKSSEKVITQLEGIGQQLAVTFNREGSLIAMGGEDGYLRVFKWPSMEAILDKADAYAAVKDLGFRFIKCSVLNRTSAHLIGVTQVKILVFSPLIYLVH
uniref:SEC12-like protein 2 n=1 Tax=Nelumbo nucifera TaxID=4432 RepID=A0A822YHL0_NELNU|nr:TPA_asm: hypothetical protein HUJ06_010921 [Nelumbo nucifera]